MTDSLSTLEKVRGSNTHQTHHTTHIRDSQTQKITWIYCPGHSGVVGTKLQTSLQARQQFQITATSLTHNLSSTWSPVMTTPSLLLPYSSMRQRLWCLQRRWCQISTSWPDPPLHQSNAMLHSQCSHTEMVPGVESRAYN